MLQQIRKHEVVCPDCGCLLPTVEETRKKYPHQCWVRAAFSKIDRSELADTGLPDSDNAHDDWSPFYEWPEPT